ncbi:hypothetical protein DRO34_04855 [Candidatus Bathyarchaeota archaeon]|nr:MAG: hypothetical protein DRO34_04855 [Candidatus Bathyarchaeota archaeon]
MEVQSLSLETPSIEELCKRVDELLIILKRLVEDLEDVSKSLKTVAAPTAPPSPPPETPTPTPPVPTPAAAEQLRTVDDIKMMFPEELESLLTFEDKGDFIMIKPRQFLGSENFAKIASIIRGAGGEYKSAGKESHFRVPKKL